MSGGLGVSGVSGGLGMSGGPGRGRRVWGGGIGPGWLRGSWGGFAWMSRGFGRRGHGFRRGFQRFGIDLAARSLGGHNVFGREIAGFDGCRDRRLAAVVLCE